MQLSAVNSQSFKGNSFKDFEKREKRELKQMEEGLQALRKAQDSLCFENEPEKKSTLGTIASVALGAAFLFAIGKKGCNKTQEAVKAITDKTKGSAKIQKFTNGVTKNIAKLTVKNKMASTLQTKISQAGSLVNEKVIKKAGLDNLAGAATAIAGTCVVANTDSNGDGVADIGQKGVNAYKGALEGAGFLHQLADIIS